MGDTHIGKDRKDGLPKSLQWRDFAAAQWPAQVAFLSHFSFGAAGVSRKGAAAQRRFSLRSFLLSLICRKRKGPTNMLVESSSIVQSKGLRSGYFFLGGSRGFGMGPIKMLPEAGAFLLHHCVFRMVDRLPHHQLHRQVVKIPAGVPERCPGKNRHQHLRLCGLITELPVHATTGRHQRCHRYG